VLGVELGVKIGTENSLFSALL